MSSSLSWNASDNDLYLNEDKIINAAISNKNCQKPQVIRHENTYTSDFQVFWGHGKEQWDIDSYVVDVDRPCCAIVAIGYDFDTAVSSPEDLVLADHSYSSNEIDSQIIRTYKYKTGSDEWHVKGFVIRIVELNKPVDGSANFHLRLHYEHEGGSDIAFDSFKHCETFLIISEQTFIDFKSASIDWTNGKLTYNAIDNNDETISGNFNELVDGKSDLTKITSTYRNNATTKSLPYTFNFSSYINEMNTIVIVGSLTIQTVEGDDSPKEKETYFDVKCNSETVPFYTWKTGSLEYGDTFENDFCLIANDFTDPTIRMTASSQMKEDVNRNFAEVFDIFTFKNISLPEPRVYDMINWENTDLILSDINGETTPFKKYIDDSKTITFIENQRGSADHGSDYVLEINGKKGDAVFVEASFRQDFLTHQTSSPTVEYTEPLHRIFVRGFNLVYQNDDYNARYYYVFNNCFRLSEDGTGQITFKMNTESSIDQFSGKVRTLHLHSL